MLPDTLGSLGAMGPQRAAREPAFGALPARFQTATP